MPIDTTPYYGPIDRYKAGQIITPDDINDLSGVIGAKEADDTLYLYAHDGTGSDWTTTSTVATAIDNTAFAHSFKVRNSGPVLVLFFGSVKGGSEMWYSIGRDGDGVDVPENFLITCLQSNYMPLTVAKYYINLSKGYHTFRVYWKSVSGAAIYLDAATKPRFMIAEGL